ncbi:hypothetical protein [Streptomyces sp. NPDC005507]|uniref:hypothetical protein n=1 Tax=unclassified Streptomyces TaxID=2593676 RepID=UPI0033B67022
MEDSNSIPLRRLPWETPAGKPAFAATDGGVISRLADAMENNMLLTAKEDAIRAADLCRDVAASRAELRVVVGCLARAVSEAVFVADLRGERIGVRDYEESEDDEDLMAGVSEQVRRNDLH